MTETRTDTIEKRNKNVRRNERKISRSAERKVNE